MDNSCRATSATYSPPLPAARRGAADLLHRTLGAVQTTWLTVRVKSEASDPGRNTVVFAGNDAAGSSFRPAKPRSVLARAHRRNAAIVTPARSAAPTARADPRTTRQARPFPPLMTVGASRAANVRVSIEWTPGISGRRAERRAGEVRVERCPVAPEVGPAVGVALGIGQPD